MSEKWSGEKARAWYQQHPWGCGFNYLPRTAVNWTEMWQSDTFDLTTIEQELGWAREYGYNQLRTNLPHIIWLNDRNGLIYRIDRFLRVADRCGMRVVLTLLDDCAFSGDEPFAGPQKPPVRGLHNSQAAGSPGRDRVVDPACWSDIERYISDIVGHFAADTRILLWDLYNEPGNRGIFCPDGEYRQYDAKLEIYALTLMSHAFGWARAQNPSQPLTVGAWHIEPGSAPFSHPVDRVALHLSDVVSYHAYVDTPTQLEILTALLAFNRPVLCTEWLARHVGSVLAEQLPLFKALRVGAFHWGLVQGKTQTWLPWPAIASRHGDDALWFHDVLTAQGQPYSRDEMERVRRLCLAG
ncbi:1,4-beta-xylanase [Atlantibacter subterranea]|uniref:1,4-beta-xylanase n=1 Tax=Atlantibacter subterraneus TaxID=255519 RepID=UPI0020C49E77|nr:1,4-beta-xylanase [Atlantibacter subterranea]UTJ45653.1 1,4-beta-xylanase [Atlantibacter subterranea]